MPLIQLQTKQGPRMVMADVIGCFAIHWAIVDADDSFMTVSVDTFVVTHVASGRRAVGEVTYEQAKAAIAAFESSGLDWTLPEGQDSVTDAHKACGERVRAMLTAEPESAVSR